MSKIQIKIEYTCQTIIFLFPNKQFNFIFGSKEVNIVNDLT